VIEEIKNKYFGLFLISSITSLVCVPDNKTSGKKFGNFFGSSAYIGRNQPYDVNISVAEIHRV
jgi:hypothetical protein